MFRIKEENPNGINFYRFNNGISGPKLNDAITKYKELTQKLIDGRKGDPNYIANEIDRKEMSRLLDFIAGQQDTLGDKKNILSKSSINDKKIGNGTDSVVYPLGELYVYKEGKEYGEEGLEYLRKKYLILKRFLGNIIPKSYFIYGESIDNLSNRGLRSYRSIKRRSITIQRKIKGKNCRQMQKNEKESLEFLIELEKAHKKYVLLKMLLFRVINELGLGRKDFDLQLDLGQISNMDGLHIDDINFIETNITSPNIMRDGNNISFIDFGSGVWNNEKELIFQKMLTPEVLERWKAICSSMNL